MDKFKIPTVQALLQAENENPGIVRRFLNDAFAIKNRNDKNAIQAVINKYPEIFNRLPQSAEQDIQSVVK